MRSILTLAVSMLALAGAGASAASARTQSMPTGATLTVNDADAIGTVGDGRLSLAEAIRLANGDLTPAQLDKGELRQVRGTPGPAAADRIRFAVKGGVVRLPLQVQARPDQAFAVLQSKSRMPVMKGNDGDSIEGRGIRLTNGPVDARDTVNAKPLFKGAPIGGTGLVIESSDLSITGVTFERFTQALSFRPAAGAAAMRGVRLTGNKFHNGGGVMFLAVSAAGERSALRDLIVRDNAFVGPRQFGDEYPSKLHSAISIVGVNGEAKDKSATAPDGVIEDVTIARNTVKEFAGGVQIQPLQTLFTANRGARLSRLAIRENDISLLDDAPDPAIYLWGAVAVNGHVADVKVSDVLVEGNKVAGNGYIVFIAGIEPLLGSTRAVNNVHVDGIRVLRNRISPRKQCAFGITTIGAFPEMNGPPATGNSVRNIEVSGNVVSGCATGMFTSPLVNVGAPGKSHDNEVHGVTYDGNTITGAQTGILVAGGALIAEEAKGPAEIASNRVSGVRITRNRIGAEKAGILVTGGYAVSKVAGSLTGNAVEGVEITGNTRIGTGGAPLCRVTGEAVVEGPTVTATDNRATATGQSCAQ